ncbi:hypothetical protein [Quadrisphaera setariae]|uniref:Uncharacterized protein n=1 Tax=Quadrisphaera setariae TaxID=2593304 RepID=A0A5C8ZJI1_9ACTN|nr:hypothetical protein [Quadrisphaera setariae]TXR57299.1 hypothetical protein FMM08_03210 [Quadrisphaera setariae]
MSHVWELEAAALGQIALAAVVLGAGLPALFAAGVRASAWGRGGSAEVGADAPAHPVGRALSGAVFAVVVLVALLGITFIVASGSGKTVSFEHVYPTVVDE